MRVEMEVRNAGRMPSPLLLAQDALAPELGARRGRAAPGSCCLASPPAGRRPSATGCVRHGAAGTPSGPLSVRLADPFGFCQIVRTFSATARISVLPAITPLRISRLGGQWVSAGKAASAAS